MELLNILKINFNTIHTALLTEQISRNQIEGWCYTNETWEPKAQRQCYEGTDSNSNNDNNTMVNNKNNTQNNFFLSGPTEEADRRVCAKKKKKQQMHKEFKDVFFFMNRMSEGIFSLQVKVDSKLYQALLRCMAYVLGKPFEVELEWLLQLNTAIPLGVDEATKQCNSFCAHMIAEWKVQTLPRSNEAKSGLDKTSQ